MAAEQNHALRTKEPPRGWYSIGGSRRWLIVLGSEVVTFAALVVAAFVTLNGISSTSARVNHTHQVRVEVERSLSTLVDVETSERGYLLTGEDSYLERYNRDLADVLPTFDHLRTLTQDNVEQQERIDQAQRLVQDRLRVFRQAVSARQTRGLDAAIAIVREGHGRQAMDEIRRLIGDMQVTEDRLLRARSAKATTEIAVAEAIFVLSSVVLALGVAAGLMIRRERTREEERGRFLEEAGATLSSSLDLNETLASVVRLAVPRLADWCAVDLLEPDATLCSVAMTHIDPEKVVRAQEMRQRHPPDTKAAVGPYHVVRTGKAEMGEVPGSPLAQSTGDDEQMRLLRELGVKSYMLVPLAVGGRMLGVITFLSESKRRYEAADLSLARELGDRASLAIYNATMFATETRTRQWLSRLQSMTADLAGAISVDHVAAITVDEGMAAVGAINEALWLLDEAGTTLELVYARGYPEAVKEAFRRIPLDAPIPITEVLRAREPMWFETHDAFLKKYPKLKSKMPERNVSEAIACLPLCVENRPIGAISLAFAEVREFSVHEQEAMITLSNLCAQALDRARLFHAEKRARAEAELATRARQDLLAIVSHDLRNPLSAAMLAAAQTARLAGPDQSGQRIRKNMSTIERLGDQMIRLIHDLLDLSKTEVGQLLSIERTRQNGADAVRQAVASLEPLAIARKLTLVADLPRDAFWVFCDANRIQQVFSNLVGNAIKFTREGGTIAVRASRVSGEIVFSVTDTGMGIPEDQLPHIFDPYWQPREQRRGSGIGLGLSVAKAIILAHDGRISVESVPGCGSTFYFTLQAVDALTGSDEARNTSLGNQAEERHT